jgi:SAM-dependent methyltransferase
MAITRHLAQFVLTEHKTRNISGTVLLLGRQMVFMTPDEAQALVEANGLSIRSDAKIEFDRTPHGASQGYISDSSFFSLFSDGVVLATDISDYEGADIVFDLSREPPSQMIGAYDFIYNGSVLDNVFDPAACIRNVSRMLKPNGVVMHYEGCAHSDPAYLKFTPDWFFDYYAINGFQDFQGYVCLYDNVHTSSWGVFEWSPFLETEPKPRVTWPLKVPKDAMVVGLAEKSPAATIDRNPVQGVYRGEDHDAYVAAFNRFSRSARRQAIRSALGQGAPQTAEVTAAEAVPQQSLMQNVVSIGRASPLKSLLPASLKAGILRRVQPALSLGQTGAAQTPGHAYLGTVG